MDGDQVAGYAAARQQMLYEQLRGRGIVSQRVLDCMGRVPREWFMLPETRSDAYADRATSIECGQTISQPYIVALMTQALELTGTEHVLEVGTGSGYQTAVLAELAGDVVSIERHALLSEQAAAVLAELNYSNVRLVVGDGTLGWPSEAPYDRILVAAAASYVPAPLLEQLAEGGILVIPVGGSGGQVLQVIRKRSGQFHTEQLSGCRFVPLVGAQEEAP